MATYSNLALRADPSLILEAAGLQPDRWQRAVLRSREDSLLCCSRQAGKSTVTAGAALHTALTQTRRLVLLLSKSERQSGELLRTIKDLYERLGRPLSTVYESSSVLDFENQSRCVALPGANPGSIRCFASVDLLVVDEAAYVSDELFVAVSPMVAVSRGRMICLSTPAGQRGFFFEQWRRGEGWQRVKVPASECPRIPAEFLQRQRTLMTAAQYAAEYECSFVEAAGAIFSGEEIDAFVGHAAAPAVFQGEEGWCL